MKIGPQKSYNGRMILKFFIERNRLALKKGSCQSIREGLLLWIYAIQSYHLNLLRTFAELGCGG